jgi:hypothetical protein
MKQLLFWKTLLEYLEGAADAPPEGVRLPLSSPWWGVLWGVLVCVILLFCGQTSKFIYIDF